jgi:hypothetical protein
LKSLLIIELSIDPEAFALGLPISTAGALRNGPLARTGMQ